MKDASDSVSDDAEGEGGVSQVILGSFGFTVSGDWINRRVLSHGGRDLVL